MTGRMGQAEEWALLECLYYRPCFVVYLKDSPFRFTELQGVVDTLSRVQERPCFAWDASEPDHYSEAQFEARLFQSLLGEMSPHAASRAVKATLRAIDRIQGDDWLTRTPYPHPDHYALKMLEYCESGIWPTYRHTTLEDE